MSCWRKMERLNSVLHLLFSFIMKRGLICSCLKVQLESEWSFEHWIIGTLWPLSKTYLHEALSLNFSVIRRTAFSFASLGPVQVSVALFLTTLKPCKGQVSNSWLPRPQMRFSALFQCPMLTVMSLRTHKGRRHISTDHIFTIGDDKIKTFYNV